MPAMTKVLVKALEPAADAVAGGAADEGRDQAHPRLEVRHHPAQVAGSDGHVAVAHQEERVTRESRQVVEIVDLGVGADAAAAGDEAGPDRGMPRGDPPGDGERRVGRIGDAEQELELRVVEPEEAGQVILEGRVEALERLQHAHRRQRGSGKRWTAAAEGPALTGGHRHHQAEAEDDHHERQAGRARGQHAR